MDGFISHQSFLEQASMCMCMCSTIDAIRLILLSVNTTQLRDEEQEQSAYNTLIRLYKKLAIHEDPLLDLLNHHILCDTCNASDHISLHHSANLTHFTSVWFELYSNPTLAVIRVSAKVDVLGTYEGLGEKPLPYTGESSAKTTCCRLGRTATIADISLHISSLFEYLEL